ncbi:hypothetical protein BCV69DRAFT_123104 [Microstroma glucosiphilum]|uniref:Uncharacterized protein n=1 Tax=Pseudomicrostroma glucosiphilum TaxID=1684307 RepID=A0A316TWH1_9BASI|nr:hypothetical protein BCV69DRAFT_123104 [Pseudomicrostroma glucosiphilum]PWN17826.1 hypothetical protein BCV69DRAFT_123104 [Pseudomicrostroma glucosiphilum]
MHHAGRPSCSPRFTEPRRLHPCLALLSRHPHGSPVEACYRRRDHPFALSSMLLRRCQVQYSGRTGAPSTIERIGEARGWMVDVRNGMLSSCFHPALRSALLPHASHRDCRERMTSLVPWLLLPDEAMRSLWPAHDTVLPQQGNVSKSANTLSLIRMALHYQESPFGTVIGSSKRKER